MNNDFSNTEKFIRRVQIDGCKVQVGRAWDVSADITPDNCADVLAALQTEDIYYTNGVMPEKIGRASDTDITNKNNLTIDFDIQKHFPDLKVEEVKAMASTITEAFKEHDVLSKHGAIVFSGGGLHFAYFGEPVNIEDSEHYKAALQDLHQDALRLLPDNLKPTLDSSCVNVARLFRLPGTKNHKWGNPRTVEVIEWSEQVCDIKQVYEHGKYLHSQASEAKKAVKAQRKDAGQLFTEAEPRDFYEAINKLIPIQEVLCTLKSWETDGRNFWEAGQRKRKACFVAEGENYLVHGGTDHLPADSKGYSVFSLVKTALALDNKKTFEWFEKHYPDIKQRASTDAVQAVTKEGKAKKALALALSQNITLFHDQFGDAYARVPIRNHHEIYRCSPRGGAIREWLSRLYWEHEKNTLSGEDAIAVLGVLSAMAKFDHARITLHNRCAYDMEGQVLWYDLANDSCQAVKVTSDGWEIIDDAPILFSREQHQKPQVIPVRSGGNAKKLLDYIKIKKQEHQILYLVNVIASFIADIPHPISVFYGRPGSSKSTATKMTKAVIDPSKMEAATFPADETQLVQQLAHHYCAAYDNIDYITAAQSDALCRAVTGGGFSKRVLYSDDDDKIYNFRRSIILNGVNQAGTRSDLVDRSLLFSLERIPDSERKTERELWANFHKDLPVILGGIFDVLCVAMKTHPSIALATHPRMADFAEWGCAIATALGYSQEQFEAALEVNKADQNETVLSEDWLAPIVLKFMADKDAWEGTATELLAEVEGLGLAGRRAPKPNTLSRHIQLISENLEVGGIFFSRGYRGNERVIRFAKTPSVSSEPTDKEPNSNADGTDATDDNSPTRTLLSW